MISPLYLNHNSPHALTNHAHAGLWFERFFNRYNTEWGLESNSKLDWINTVAKYHLIEQTHLDKVTARQIALVRQLNGKSHRYNTEWNFVTGLGNPHPVENGFSWHPTLGVPYLAGSAVKGLVRAWVERNDDALSPNDLHDRLKSWFGTAQKDDVAEQAGGFIFFDALPDKPPTLVCDIMTPHMGKWYSEGDRGDVNNSKAIPADWHEPVPIPFLAVKKARLIFGIAPRRPELSTQLDLVFNALTQALEWLGAGAKTSTGYGYMTLDKVFAEEQLKAIQQEQKNQQLASLNEQQQQIMKLQELFQQKQQRKANETIGGELYNSLKQQVGCAHAWSVEDKETLRTLGLEILAFLGCASNRKAKELIKQLD